MSILQEFGTDSTPGQSSCLNGSSQPWPHSQKNAYSASRRLKTLLGDTILRKKTVWKKIKGNHLQGSSSIRREGYSESEKKKKQPICPFACWHLPSTLSWASKTRIYQNPALAKATQVMQLDLNWNIWCLLICSNKFTRSWLCTGN